MYVAVTGRQPSFEQLMTFIQMFTKKKANNKLCCDHLKRTCHLLWDPFQFIMFQTLMHNLKHP